ncbi:MAG: hypothetical protein PHR22_02020 [Candidatus Omnitrophica bacterium]|nr:hypothetical protein [Candidatus Omnitrophota bacterium]
MKIRKLAISLTGILLFAACCAYAEDEYSDTPNDNSGTQENVDNPETADTPVIENKDNKDIGKSGDNTLPPEPTTEPVGKHIDSPIEGSVNNPDGPDGGSVTTESVNNPGDKE